MAVYPEQPTVEDIKTIAGTSWEPDASIPLIYLIRKKGDYTLPQIRVEWWNLTAGKVQTAALPSIHFRALPNPAYRPELAPEPEPVPASAPAANTSAKQYLHLAEIAVISLVALGSILWAWFRFGTRLRHQRRESRLALEDSETAFFAKLRKACRKSQAKDAYPLLLGWLNRFAPGIPLSQFISNVGDARLASEVELLTSEFYGHSNGATWSGNQMIAALQRVRTRSRGMRHVTALPPLNPDTRP